MKSNINIVSGPNNIVYLKFGEKIVQLKGIDFETVKKYIFEIKNNSFSIGNNKQKKDFMELLTNIGALKRDTSFSDILTNQNIPNNLNKKIIVGALGDDDLINGIIREYPNLIIKKLDLKDMFFQKDDYDFGVIISRKYNAKKWLKYNENFFITDKIFYPILLQETEFTIGPKVIPHQTSCAKCMRIHELDNNYYGEIINIFDKLDVESTEFIPSELIDLAFSFIRNQLIKDYLLQFGTAVEPELAQKVYSYQFLEGVWKEHNLLKSPKCNLCFPNSISSEQTFEVKN